jgi:hypothetical protein
MGFGRSYETWQSVLNPLSQAIIGPDGRPGPNFARAAQSQASQHGAYALEPARSGAYPGLPRPDTTSAQGQPARISGPADPGRSAQRSVSTDPLHQFQRFRG